MVHASTLRTEAPWITGFCSYFAKLMQSCVKQPEVSEVMPTTRRFRYRVRRRDDE